MEFPGSFLRYHFMGKPVSGFFSGYKYVCCVCYLALTGTSCTQYFFSILTFFFVREEVKEMMNKRKTGSETLAAFEEHLNEVSFSNLRTQAAFCNAFISSLAKWFLGMKFLCLFLRHHFMGKPLVALQNVGCFFFFGQAFSGYWAWKKLVSPYPSGKQLLNFPHPEQLPIFLNTFCVYVYDFPGPLLVVWTREP